VAVQVAPGRPLTHRELEVALLAVHGMQSSAIARLLFVSPRTVHAHLRSAYRKTGTGNRVQLLNWLSAQEPATADGDD
jgi:DNA-binding CsgD family transcriptional regulator